MEFVLKSSFALAQISLSTVVLDQKLLLCFHEHLGFLKSWPSLFCMVDDYHLSLYETPRFLGFVNSGDDVGRLIRRFGRCNNSAGAIFHDAVGVVTYFPSKPR